MENTGDTIAENNAENNAEINDNNHDFCSKTNCKTKEKKCYANFCVICGVNLGYENPRQLCGKTYCPYED